MSVPIARCGVCWLLLVTLPVAMNAADTGAMLSGQGPVWLNNSPLPRSSAISRGDSIRTEAGATANINAAGTSVVIQMDSLVKYEGQAVSLEHGSISITTSTRAVAQATEVKVEPISISWTEFEVTDVDGTVRVTARKGAVNMQCGKELRTISEGESLVRDESGRCARKKAGAYPPTRGDILTNRYALVGGGAVLALCASWLCLSSSAPSPPPPSNSNPSR